jgi:hypothetical protein
MLTRAAPLLLACIACWLGVDIACAEETAEAASRRDQLTAAYLSNFVKFVEWPDLPAGSEVVVCFAGAAGVHNALAAAPSGKVAIIRVSQVQKAADVSSCNMLYLDTAAATSGQWMPAPPKVLTVSDADAFALRGGMIALFTQGNRLRFNINLGTAQKAGLRVRAALLQLAASVEMTAR